MLAAFAFSCGDGGNRSSERDGGMDNLENRQPMEPAEADTSTNDFNRDYNRSDTASTWDQDRDNTMDNNTMDGNNTDNTLDERTNDNTDNTLRRDSL